MEGMIGKLKSIEDEAEKILESAGYEAKRIISEADSDSAVTKTDNFNLDEARAEAKKIVDEARSFANRQIAESNLKAQSISDLPPQKINDIAQRVVGIILGDQIK
ncbi:MAG: hypothetical protein WC958_00735 [Dehalococcoidales bacterium]